MTAILDKQPATTARAPRRRRRVRIGRLLSLTVLTVTAALVVAPLVWALATSLRTPATSFDNPPQWIPTDPVWSNYQAVFDKVPFTAFFLNSVIVTGLIVVGQLITSTMSGYAFAMVRFRGNKALFAVILATMMVPIQTTIIPVFLIIKYLGLTDSRMALVLPAVGGAFGTFLMRQYFLQMPRELGEAARVDGASHFQVFARIYAPMARAPMATLGVLTFSAYWNEFFRPLIFLQSTDNFTLPLGLVTLQGNMGTGSISIVLAAVIIALIPSVLIFLAAQRYFVEGIVAGSFR
ncbi:MULTISPECIES: carbohydrate ABC transporter permease [Streptomyces]|uniref:L-arabinose transport system permease protein AraQ n=1 Tax=Streptomyces chartreusis NRRL 3882 TaxID=1079985 RepID=A0A2N9BAC5_STRCX|nr:carbohydrate ABC transporter permease [Streptomyces chartreusis]SOR80296.1 L-arabinose transport system permease protein AraQ [Streptomyces chartreusis NRRL 3882]